MRHSAMNACQWASGDLRKLPTLTEPMDSQRTYRELTLQQHHHLNHHVAACTFAQHINSISTICVLFFPVELVELIWEFSWSTLVRSCFGGVATWFCVVVFSYTSLPLQHNMGVFISTADDKHHTWLTHNLVFSVGDIVINWVKRDEEEEELFHYLSLVVKIPS